jgi:signal transduction histidine kinase
MQELNANWQAYDREFRVLRPDGTARWIRLRSFTVYNKYGEIYRLAGVASDRTEQRATEAALIQAERLTTAGKLAASLAHEINNPLQSVIGCLGLAQGAVESGKDPGTYLQIARQEVKRTAQIVSELRSLGRPIQDRPKEPKDVNNLLNDVLVLNKGSCGCAQSAPSRRLASRWSSPTPARASRRMYCLTFSTLSTAQNPRVWVWDCS